MIASLQGTVLESSAQQIVLDVQGVGYAVSVVDHRLYPFNKVVKISIYYHWNQEQGPHLYGFDDALSKDVFAQIISCSGCGPKIGLAALAKMAPQEFLRAIVSGDEKSLSSINGIGKKKAELIIMQLKDKVGRIISHGPAVQHATVAKLNQIHQALEALGYKHAEIVRALESVTQSSKIEENSFDELIKKALSFLLKR